MAKNFYDSPWSWILGLLSGIPFPAFKDAVTDDYGANAVDREFVAYLKRQVEKGEITEEEARKALSDRGYNGKGSSDDFYDSVDSSVGKGIEIGGSGLAAGITGVLQSLVAYYTRNELTGAEREMNEFNAGEAQKSRDFTEFMARNKYSMETQSMQEAGVNPALVYGGGNLVPTAANGATASSSNVGAGNIADLLGTMVRMPLELKRLQADIQMSRDNAYKARMEGEAAIMNAQTNRMNVGVGERQAGAAERQAGAAERQAAVQEARVKIDQILADNNTRATDSQIAKWAADEAYVRELINWLPTEVAIKQKHASAAQTSAWAAVQQAKAAQQNADTNSKITDSQVLLNEVLRQKEAVYRDYLPAQLSAQVDEMRARGYYFNQQGQLVDKQGKLVEAQIAREYVGLACDVARTACQVAGTVATAGAGGVLVRGETGGPAPSSAPQYHDYSLGTYGTYGD